MTDTTRNLIRRLADELTNAIRVIHNEDGTQHISTATPVLTEARAYLSQPEPEGLTDEALASFTAYFCRNYPGPNTIIHNPEWHAPKIFHAAADAIARWGRPAIQPEANGTA